MTTEFKVGDIVEFGGLEGEVAKMFDLQCEYPVKVKLSSGEDVYFTIDGKLNSSHTKPLLKKVKETKKKKTVRVWQFLRDGIASGVFYTEDLKKYWTGEELGSSCISDTSNWTITNNYADVEVEV